MRRERRGEVRAECLDEFEDHLRTGACRHVVPVDVAVHHVTGVVIDVDEQPPLEPGDARSAQGAALEYHDGVERVLHRRGDLDRRHAR